MRVFYVTSLRGLYLEGLIHGGAYFRNFTVFKIYSKIISMSTKVNEIFFLQKYRFPFIQYLEYTLMLQF